MKRKAFWVLLAAGIIVFSTGVVSAQWTDRETLTRMISGDTGSRVAMSPPESTAAGPRTGMLGVPTKNSLVGSWLETATFPPVTGRPPLKSLTAFHDDGTMAANDQGSVTTDPPSGPAVFTAGVGVWTRLRSRMFAYTQYELISDLKTGDLMGFLKVRGTYTLESEDHYTGSSYYEGFDAGGKPIEGFSGWVTNEGQRILLKLPPSK